MEKLLKKIAELLMNMKNYKKMTKKIIFAITFSFLFSNFSFAQKIDIVEYVIEIIEAFN